MNAGPTDPIPVPEPLVYGPVTRTDLVRYQGASGDFYPIHHDEPFARSAGLPAPLVLGMFSAGLLASWATDWLGADAVRAFRVRFAARVFPGDTLTCSGEVLRDYRSEDGEARRDLALTCRTGDGEVAVRGWATFVTADPAAVRPTVPAGTHHLTSTSTVERQA